LIIVVLKIQGTNHTEGGAHMLALGPMTHVTDTPKSHSGCKE